MMVQLVGDSVQGGNARDVVRSTSFPTMLYRLSGRATGDSDFARLGLQHDRQFGVGVETAEIARGSHRSTADMPTAHDRPTGWQTSADW